MTDAHYMNRLRIELVPLIIFLIFTQGAYADCVSLT